MKKVWYATTLKNETKMMKYSRNGVSVRAVADRRRLKKNGMYPVKIEVIYRRKQVYFPTGEDATDEEWEQICDRGISSEKGAMIERAFSRVMSEADRLIRDGKFSLGLLGESAGCSQMSLNAAMEASMAELKKGGRMNSWYRVRSTLRAVEDFAGRDIDFADITPRWLSRCEKYWLDGGKCCTTVNIYMKTLKSVWRSSCATSPNSCPPDPFGRGRYEIPAANNRKLALSKEQVRKIMEWTGDGTAEMWRDLWIFSYLCNGINFRDMIFLRHRDIRDGELTFVRSKTSRPGKRSGTIHAVVTPEMEKIIARWGTGAEKDGFIFPFAREGMSPREVTNLVRKVICYCNKALRTVAAETGVPAFTTYAARHTYATVLCRSGADISYISESLGHTSIRTTQAYLGSFGREDRRRFSRALL